MASSGSRWQQPAGAGAYLMPLLVVLLCSGNIVVGRALNELPPVTIAFFRLLIALAALAPFGLRSAWRSRAVFRRHARPLLLMTLTGVTFFNTLIYASLRFTSATSVAVLETAIPALTAVLGAWVLREHLRAPQWLGVLMSFAGAAWVAASGQAKVLDSLNAGDMTMVGAVVCWAVYSLAVRRHLGLFPVYGGVLVMTAISVLVLGPLMAAEWLLLGSVPDIDPNHWWGLAYLGVFPSVVALLLYNRAVAVLGVARAAVFLNLLPLFTMGGAALLLGEPISAVQVLGAAVVITGLLLTAGAGGTARADAVDGRASGRSA